jgi:hypothetical protein
MNPFAKYAEDKEDNPFTKYSKADKAAVNAGSALNDIPRQLGLTARYAIQGPAKGAQLFTEPIRAVTDRVFGGQSQSLGTGATRFADWLGLPSPETPAERTVGSGAEMGFGAMGFSGLSALANKLQTGVKAVAAPSAASAAGAIQNLPKQLAANPASQVSAAAGAGTLGQSSVEAGGSPMYVVGASLIGGIAGGLTPAGLNKITSVFNSLKSSPLQLEGKIELALKEGGVDWKALSVGVRNQLLADVKKATSTGDDLNPQALRRLADIRAAGLTPTRGSVTLDPVQVTREMNLAKMGANTGDEAFYTLPRIQNQNNAQLIANLNNMGASRGDPVNAGETVVNTILGRQSALRGAEQAAWDAAKGSPGYRMPVSAGVLSDINMALDEQALMPFMNPTISRYMAAFQTGNQPFTPQAYRNLQSMLSNEITKGGNEAAAARVAANILRSADLKPAGFANPGNLPVTASTAAQMRFADEASGGAVDAVNRARTATRTAYAFEDASPLIRSVLKDPDPQKIAQRFIVSGTAKEAEELIQAVGPRNLEPIKNALLVQLKEKALSGAADETGKFSQSAFNRALKQIGERKLSLFFSPEELQLLQQNARAASYIQFQPAGSAVNNSNSGALMLGSGYDLLSGFAGKLPFGKQLIVDPLAQRNAMNVVPGLLNPTQSVSPLQSMVVPAMAGGGLLSAPSLNSP